MSAFAPDLVLLGIILASGFHAFTRGVIEELILILLWITSFCVSYYAAPFMAPWLNNFVPFESFSSFIAYIVLFVGTMFIFGIVLTPIRKVMTRLTGMINRIFGFFYGIVRGIALIVIFTVGYLALARNPAEQDTLLMGGFIYPWCEALAKVLYSALGSPSVWNLLPGFLR